MNCSPVFYIWWKEFRAVLPLWGIALIALVLPTITGSASSRLSGPADWAIVTYPVGVIAFIAAIFTREFQDKTMLSQMLLPQHRFTPLVRKLCVALTLQLSLFAVYLFVLTPREWENPDLWAFILGVNAVALAGGCFWGLITKQRAATVVISIASPWITGIMGLGFVQWFALNLGPNGEGWIMVAGLGVYTIICAVGAIVYWNRYQSKGESVVVSGLDTSVLSRIMGQREFAQCSTWLALVRKEVGIQRFCFWLAAMMIFSAFLFTTADFLIGMSIQANDGITAEMERAHSLQSLVRAFGSAVFVIFLGITPVLAGAQAFAEESHLGNRAWQLTQPVSARRQWAFKLGTAALISAIVGLVLPVIIAWGYAMLRMGETFLPGFEEGAIPSFLLIHALIFCSSAWCATWSSTTISAIMKSALVLLGFFVLQGWFTSFLTRSTLTNGGGYHADLVDWRWVAISLVVVEVVLSLQNNGQVIQGKRRIVSQSIALFLIAVGVMFVDALIR